MPICDNLNNHHQVLRSIKMGEVGKKDKGKKEQRKKPKLTIKEKRKQKQEKHSNTAGSL
jgi:hypothetical protein